METLSLVSWSKVASSGLTLSVDFAGDLSTCPFRSFAFGGLCLTRTSETPLEPFDAGESKCLIMGGTFFSAESPTEYEYIRPIIVAETNNRKKLNGKNQFLVSGL